MVIVWLKGQWSFWRWCMVLYTEMPLKSTFQNGVRANSLTASHFHAVCWLRSGFGSVRYISRNHYQVYVEWTRFTVISVWFITSEHIPVIYTKVARFLRQFNDDFMSVNSFKSAPFFRCFLAALVLCLHALFALCSCTLFVCHLKKIARGHRS